MSKRGAAAEELRVRGFRMRSKIQRWEANGNGEDENCLLTKDK